MRNPSLENDRKQIAPELCAAAALPKRRVAKVFKTCVDNHVELCVAGLLILINGIGYG
jgi:hypothetical protein